MWVKFFSDIVVTNVTKFKNAEDFFCVICGGPEEETAPSCHWVSGLLKGMNHLWPLIISVAMQDRTMNSASKLHFSGNKCLWVWCQKIISS